MKFLKKSLAMVLAVAICFGATGCGNEEKEKEQVYYKGLPVYFTAGCDDNTVFMIGESVCSKAEAMTYLLNYKNAYGVVEDANLWTDGFNTDTITASLKDAVLSHLTKVYTLDLYAKEQGVTLSDDDLKKISEAADEYYKSLTKEEIKYLGLSKESIDEMYQHYVLAQKINSVVMASVDEEVSEDECRVMEAFVLYVPTKEEAKEIQGLIDYGYTFERLASTYTQKDYYQRTFARKEFPEAVDEVAFGLDTNEVSKAAEGDDGYYFFQCINKYVEDLSEENKVLIIEQRRQKVIDEITTSLTPNYYSDYNQEMWADIDLDGTENYSTDSFFSVLKSHISY